MSKKLQDRRYYLHSRVKKSKIRLLPRKRTIYYPVGQELKNPHALMLKNEFNYKVQFYIK